MSASEIHSFEDFWPHYVRAHSNPYNRALHYVGTSCAIGCVATGVATLNPWWFVAAPIVEIQRASTVQSAARNTTPLYGGFMRARSRSGWRRVEGVLRPEVSDGGQNA